MVQFFVAMLLSFTASAQVFDSANVLTLDPEIQRGDIYQPDGFWPLLGVGVGATDSNRKVRTGGMPSHIKLLGSYYFQQAPWVADLGVGLHNQFLTQSGQDADTIQSLYTEIAARYRFPNRWQVGGLWNTLLDNPDRYQSNTNNLASFMGLQVMKEFTWSDQYLVRAGGRMTTDIGISRANVDTIMAELEVSFMAPAKVAEVTPPPEPVKVVSSPHLARKAFQTIQIEPGPVNFESDSTRLVSGSQQYLRRLARVLADNRELFDRVEVVGHADQRGTDPYNDKLSQRRAQTIAKALVDAGLTRKQVESEGRGKRQLLSHANTPGALQRNRRVQLHFEGVKNQVALKHLIDSLSR